MSAALPPGIDRPKRMDPVTGRKVATGMIRARYRCDGCEKHPSGGQHSKTWPERGNKRVAARWLREQQEAVEKGTYVAPTTVTVGEYVQRWIDSRRRIKPTTREIHQQRAKHLGRLADRPMQSLRPDEIDRWVGEIAEQLSPSTVRATATLVRSALDLAVRRGDLARSPYVDIDLPVVERHEVVPLTVEQVEAIAAEMPDRYRIGVYLQAALGLRISEVLALRVADVQFLRSPARVSIRQQLARDGRTFVTPKTKGSVREVVLAERVKGLLAEHIRRYPHDDGLVLSTVHGNALTQKVYSRQFRAALTRVEGLPDGVSPHSLRHHAASVLVARGVPVNVVAKFLGHADAQMVLRVYAHLMPDADDVTAAALNAVWAPSVSQGVSQGVGPRVANGV